MNANIIINGILEANPTRSTSCLNRRIIKILEEVGEASEAYLSRTSDSNYKNKTWADFREECVDTMIVMVDVALTQVNDNYPPATLLPTYLTEAFHSPAQSMAEIEALLFTVTQAVCSAQASMIAGKDMSFYGTIGRGVKASAALCYAQIPNHNVDNITAVVEEVVALKLAKWKKRLVPTPVLVQDVDPKDYFEQIMDRNI